MTLLDLFASVSATEIAYRILICVCVSVSTLSVRQHFCYVYSIAVKTNLQIKCILNKLSKTYIKARTQSVSTVSLSDPPTLCSPRCSHLSSSLPAAACCVRTDLTIVKTGKYRMLHFEKELTTVCRREMHHICTCIS